MVRHLSVCKCVNKLRQNSRVEPRETPRETNAPSVRTRVQVSGPVYVWKRKTGESLSKLAGNASCIGEFGVSVERICLSM